MRSEPERVSADSLIGQDVTGWLVEDEYGEFRESIGVVKPRFEICGKSYIAIRLKSSNPILRSGSPIRVIKPVVLPPPKVREMTDEEVLKRAEGVLLVRYAISLDGTHEEAFWGAAHDSIRRVNRVINGNFHQPSEPPPPVVTPPKVMKVEELQPGDSIRYCDEFWVLECKPDHNATLWRFKNSSDGNRMSFETASSLTEKLGRGYEFYRDGTLISGWPIATLSPAETEGGE